MSGTMDFGFQSLISPPRLAEVLGGTLPEWAARAACASTRGREKTCVPALEISIR